MKGIDLKVLVTAIIKSSDEYLDSHTTVVTDSGIFSLDKWASIPNTATVIAVWGDFSHKH